MAGTGRPAGTAPTTLIPTSCRENSATTTAASATTISGPGNRGATRVSVNSSTTRTMPRIAVGQCS